MFRFALALLLVSSSRPLRAEDYEAAPITITATPRPSKTLTAPAAVTVLTGRELERKRGQSVMQTIQDAPGVTVNTTGAGIAKPVVRGLTSQRVLTLTDGVRQEGQQWGDEHGPEIDANGVDRIEIVRGPQSLLYGPEALSGVINVVRRQLRLDDPSFKFGGLLALDGFTHNSQTAGSIEARGEGRGFGAAVRASGRSAGEIRTAKGRLFNSGMEERSTGASLAAKAGEAALRADFSRFDQMLKIHKDPVASPGATAYQRVGHEKAILRADAPLPSGKLSATAGWQRNERQEFETAGASAKLRLVLDTWTGDLKYHHDPLGPFEGTLGVSGGYQRNDSRASDERLIPGYNQKDLGVFLFEELPLGSVTLSAGGRYDVRRMSVTADQTLSVADQVRRYNSVSGSFGASWAFAEGWALVGNAGSGWRAPSAFELFVNGEHEGSGRFEVGRADLKPERSINTDVSVRRQSGTVQAEVTAFRNRVNHFIFARPTGNVDAGSGLPIFNIAQGNATLIGGEADVKWQARDWLGLNLGADVLRAQNDDLRQPLPQMPANRIKWGVRLSRADAGHQVKDAYVSASGRLVARQNRVAANEQKTAGYGLVDFGAGAELPLLGARARADLGVENAFDLPYRDHLSRYRAYALNAGRSFTLKLTVPFGS
ncbi:MAG: TonB-dependent receptor [Elusimicrobiota bacterium]|nr:MAG: TonB-dependent receptor [Elusimicrobiota bacterium]